jgi:hypothetical protein
MDYVGRDLNLRGRTYKNDRVSLPVQVLAIFSNLLDIYDVYLTRILRFHAVSPSSMYGLSYFKPSHEVIF